MSGPISEVQAQVPTTQRGASLYSCQVPGEPRWCRTAREAQDPVSTGLQIWAGAQAVLISLWSTAGWSWASKGTGLEAEAKARLEM